MAEKDKQEAKKLPVAGKPHLAKELHLDENTPGDPSNFEEIIKSEETSKLDLPKKFVSLAEDVWKYQHHTPRRFRRYPSCTAPAAESDKINWNLKLTVPQSPKLHTEKRMQKRKMKTTECETKAEMPEIKTKKIVTKKISANKAFILKNILAPKISKNQVSKPPAPKEPVPIKRQHCVTPKISIQVIQARKLKSRAVTQARKSMSSSTNSPAINKKTEKKLL